MSTFIGPFWKNGHLFLVAAILLIATFTNQALAQRKNNDRRDEQRENERVNKAEKEVNEAQKKLSNEQKDHKFALRDLNIAKDKLTMMRRVLREAEKIAEKEIGAKIGIPEAMDLADSLSEKCDEIEKPILEKLRKTPEFVKADEEATAAKSKRSELEWNAELEDSERDEKMKELTPTIKRPLELEEKALSEDKDAVAARTKFNDASSKLADLRGKISREKVESHTKVKPALANVKESEKTFASAERAVVAAKSSVMKAQKQLASAQTELAKAKQADAKDPNRPKGKK
jgi:chromosome segregation ATPase